MLATPENGNAFTAADGASFLVAGLMEVAAEIESLRMQDRPQPADLPNGRGQEDKSPDAHVIGAAFALGALLPFVSHATSLGLGAATKLLVLSASLAPMIFAH